MFVKISLLFETASTQRSFEGFLFIVCVSYVSLKFVQTTEWTFKVSIYFLLGVIC